MSVREANRKPADVSTRVGRTTYRVLYGDVDSMEVVYYGNYFRLFERGRAEFIRDLGLPYKEIETRGVMLPVIEAHGHYNGSARYDDLVLIETRVGFIRRASVRFDYEIFRGQDRLERLVDGYTVHACVDRDRKIVRLPEFLVRLLLNT
ncbi:MAG: thioesterase family protein [Thermodesulfobacteriota bacterium]